ncbi:MAG TPA: MBL fold metallo-hydrolase [Candidatus Binatia bacterium]|jgi:glyoxylase-like metal-dependent hydrolase (beta-lactamase superfamily II)
MKLKRPFMLVAVCLLFLGASAPVRMTMKQLAPNVYFMENPTGSSNAAFVITDDGVFVFDFDIRTADQTLVAVRKLTDKKIRYIVSSHSAGDHATGAWHFREDKPVYIATKNQVQDLRMQEGLEFEERSKSNEPNNRAYRGKELVLPDIGFDHDMTLYFGGLTFQIIAEGRAHSTGDLTVYIPQKRIMLMGDLLDTEIHPGQGESAGVFYSNVKGWIQDLDNIMARNLPVETYVPGHGPVHVGRGVKDLEEQKRYFVVMRDEVAKMIAAGKSLEQIEKEFKVPQEFAHYKRPERLKNFYKLFYNQLLETGY